MDKQEIIDYLMYTPYNTNLAVLKSMLGDGDWNELLDYVRQTSYRMNKHVLDGILGADDGIVLLDGTYEFIGDEISGFYGAELDKCYNPANITVTVDGTTATLPKFADGRYGEFDNEEHDDAPIYTTYPAAVALSNRSGGAMLVVGVPTAGEHTVKVTVPNGSEVECDSYTVTWMNGDVVLDNEAYNAGDVPVYKGETPTSRTKQFKGWNFDPTETQVIDPLPPVYGDITYYAIFSGGK